MIRSSLPSLKSLRREVDTLTEHMQTMETHQAQEIAAVRREQAESHRELSQRIQEAIAESKGEFFVLRLLGLWIALTGSGLLAPANFY